MIDREQFARGLAELGITFKPMPDDAAVRLYYERLSARLDDEGWWMAVRMAQERHRSSFFPAIADLLAWGAAASTSVASAANVAFDLVVHRGSVHDLEHGARPCECVPPYRWSPAALERRYGVAVARAFVEAGGNAVFIGMLERDAPFIRKRFVDAYTDRVEMPDGGIVGLPPGDVARALETSPVPMLPTVSTTAPIDKEHAAHLVRALARRKQ
jgi:hypothetical protein